MCSGRRWRARQRASETTEFGDFHGSHAWPSIEWLVSNMDRTAVGDRAGHAVGSQRMNDRPRPIDRRARAPRGRRLMPRPRRDWPKRLRTLGGTTHLKEPKPRVSASRRAGPFRLPQRSLRQLFLASAPHQRRFENPIRLQCIPGAHWDRCQNPRRRPTRRSTHSAPTWHKGLTQEHATCDDFCEQLLHRC